MIRLRRTGGGEWRAGLLKCNWKISRIIRATILNKKKVATGKKKFVGLARTVIDVFNCARASVPRLGRGIHANCHDLFFTP